MKMSARFLAVSALVLGLAGSVSAAVETYTIDPVHSSVNFSLRHLVSKFTGSFTKASGPIPVDRDNLKKSSVDAVIDVVSINTADPKRDAHVKSPDFFDFPKFSSITFKS